MVAPKSSIASADRTLPAVLADFDRKIAAYDILAAHLEHHHSVSVVHLLRARGELRSLLGTEWKPIVQECVESLAQLKTLEGVQDDRLLPLGRDRHSGTLANCSMRGPNDRGRVSGS